MNATVTTTAPAGDKTDHVPVTNALSFDIEDWFHMVEIEAVADPRCWPDLDSIVERYTEWIVQTVTEAKVTATFFILGGTSVRYARLVKRIPASGPRLAPVQAPGRQNLVLISERLGEDPGCVRALVRGRAPGLNRSAGPMRRRAR